MALAIPARSPFTAYSFAGLDPRGLRDRYADYWTQNVEHTRQNYWHCVANPHDHRGYGKDCWGLTACHGPRGYAAHSPEMDSGVLAPSAALSSFPYAPSESMRALRGFLTKPLNRIWGRFGFVDSFSENLDWYARTYLAINQGPLIAMIENYRSGLLWNLLMSVRRQNIWDYRGRNLKEDWPHLVVDLKRRSFGEASVFE